MAQHALSWTASTLTLDDCDHVVPRWIDNSVGMEGGPGFCTSTDKSLKFRFETDFLGPITIRVLPFDAVHSLVKEYTN